MKSFHSRRPTYVKSRLINDVIAEIEPSTYASDLASRDLGRRTG
jgi:hypothetical protein